MGYLEATQEFTDGYIQIIKFRNKATREDFLIDLCFLVDKMFVSVGAVAI